MRDILDGETEELADLAKDKADQLFSYAAEGRELQSYEEPVRLYAELQQLNQQLELLDPGTEATAQQENLDLYDQSHLGVDQDYAALKKEVEMALRQAEHYVLEEVVEADDVNSELQEQAAPHLERNDPQL